ncbi:hypothetical protein DID75_05475 [Candidatus Marinamargulisbacteria bacterium SCGC AG-410-N11]|nr:hypothetical protein DID75_05475 [Candidatus Marinamargulisbacteria bacterium SCGC AG-410-N11]
MQCIFKLISISPKHTFDKVEEASKLLCSIIKQNDNLTRFKEQWLHQDSQTQTVLPCYEIGKDRLPLLYISAKYNRISIFKFLMSKPSKSRSLLNLDKGDFKGGSPLNIAVGYQSLDIISFILDHQLCDIDQALESGETPLHTAVALDNIVVVTKLLNAGANIDATNKKGFSAVHYATSKGFLDITNLLLDRGANFSKRDNEGRTPLYFASSKGFFSIVDAIIKKRPVPMNNESPLLIAKSANHVKVANILEGYLGLTHKMPNLSLTESVQTTDVQKKCQTNRRLFSRQQKSNKKSKPTSKQSKKNKKNKNNRSTNITLTTCSPTNDTGLGHVANVTKVNLSPNRPPKKGKKKKLSPKKIKSISQLKKKKRKK